MRANTLNSRTQNANYQADAQLTSELPRRCARHFSRSTEVNAMETFPGSVCDFVADVGVRVGQRNGLNTRK